MTIRSLSTASMIGVLEYLTQNEKARPLLESNSLLAPMLPRFQKILQALISSREVSGSLSPEKEKQLRSSLGRLDETHDHHNRLVFGLLGIAAENATSEAYRTELTTLQGDLYPIGLSINKQKWVEEAGEAKRFGEQLEDPTVKATLSSITLETKEFKTTAFEAAQKIVDAGSKMSELLVQLHTASDVESSAEVEARRQFTRLIPRFVSLVEMEFDDEADATLILKALHDALASLQGPTETKAPPETPDKPAWS